MWSPYPLRPERTPSPHDFVVRVAAPKDSLESLVRKIRESVGKAIRRDHFIPVRYDASLPEPGWKLVPLVASPMTTEGHLDAVSINGVDLWESYEALKHNAFAKTMVELHDREIAAIEEGARQARIRDSWRSVWRWVRMERRAHFADPPPCDATPQMVGAAVIAHVAREARPPLFLGLKYNRPRLDPSRLPEGRPRAPFRPRLCFDLASYETDPKWRCRTRFTSRG